MKRLLFLALPVVAMLAGGCERGSEKHRSNVLRLDGFFLCEPINYRVAPRRSNKRAQILSNRERLFVCAVARSPDI